MLIAVTGASGFVGGRIVAALIARGHDVIGFGRRPAPHVRDYRHWDLTSGSIEAPPGVQALVHCASMVGDWGTAAAFEATNIGGTRAVLASFVDVERFVYISTASVYDPARPTCMLGEDAPYGRHYLNDYSRTKMLAECEIRAADRPSVILRPHAIYGPGDTTLLPRVLAARRLGWLAAVGDGRNLLSVTHVDNLVQAVVLAVEGSCGAGIFNVADALPARLDDLLRALLLKLGLPERVAYVPTTVAWPLAHVLVRFYRARRATQPPKLTPYVVRQLAYEYTLDISAAQHVLGYAPALTYLTGPLSRGDEQVAGQL